MMSWKDGVTARKEGVPSCDHEKEFSCLFLPL